ncbi:MAG: nucleotide exchange factor GrpE [Firmicutes bacterium]|nr:nucleotide exchange factor GrpE [Bacillota bacterium]
MSDELTKDEALKNEDQESVVEEHIEEDNEETNSVEDLKQQLKEKEVQIEDYNNRMLRAQADFDNFRRRSRQEKEDLLKYAGEDIINELLPVLDNFERALGAAENPGEDFISGVSMIFKQLKAVLEKAGLEIIPAVGEQFDPNKHEAVMQVDSEEHAENVIVEELRRGYILKDKVIRPAMVKVSN